MTHHEDPSMHPEYGTSDVDRAADSPFERLNTFMHSSIDQLELYQVTPNSFTRETQRIPFGRFGDGSLATSMTVDEGFLSGRISFVSGESRDSFMLRRDLEDNAWHTQSRRTTSNAGLARRLDANWPPHIDNSTIRRESDNDDVTFDTLYDIIEEELAPHAKYFTVEKIYAYNNIDINGATGACRTIAEVYLASKADHDGFRTVTAQAGLADHINGLDTTIYCRAASDQMGDVTMTVWYNHPETGKRVEIPIRDTVAIAAGLERMIQILLNEKLASA